MTIKKAEVKTLVEAADAASRVAVAAQAEHRQSTRAWKMEVRSLRVQLTRMAGNHKRKVRELHSDSDPDDSPVGRDPD
mgnify:CR=1 FL=1